MKTSDYQRAKSVLKGISDESKRIFKNDIPAINQTINDEADFICKNNSLSEYQQKLLHNYACTLHPKTK